MDTSITYLSTAEAAKIWGISQSTARRRVEFGLVKSMRVGGRNLIPTSEVERLRLEPPKMGRPKKS